VESIKRKKLTLFDGMKLSSIGNNRRSSNGYKDINKKLYRFDSDCIYAVYNDTGHEKEIGINKNYHRVDHEYMFDSYKDMQ
jgi:hypothetical protein